MTRRILVTGAGGFVGRAVAVRLAAAGCDAVCTHRRAPAAREPGRIAVVPDIGPETDWSAHTDGIDAVVHLAAIAHKTDPSRRPTREDFLRMNSLAALNLARQAARAGVRRFVFLSSIGVHGITSDTPLGPDSPLAPQEDYAFSKLDAENRLQELSAQTGIELVIVRAPMVYGRECSGNLLRLMRLIDRQYPLPLASVQNQRSLVGVGNLAAFLELCTEHPGAAGRVWPIADAPDISTPDIIRLLARGMGRRARLVAVPPAVLRTGTALLGKSDVLLKLCGSLRVDSSDARTRLGWRQAEALDEGLVEVGRWFAQARAHG